MKRPVHGGVVNIPLIFIISIARRGEIGDVARAAAIIGASADAWPNRRAFRRNG